MVNDKPKALILTTFEPAAITELKTRAEVICESWLDTRKLLSPEELVERIESENLQIVVIEADFVFDEVFEKTNKVRFIGICRASVNNVDVDAATKHGVLVVNTPARNAISVAELTVGLMLSLARRIPQAHYLVKSGQWVDPVGPYISMRGLELAGKVIGIVGFGAIGSEVARRLRAFDMTVVVYDPHLSPQEITKAGARQVNLRTLVKQSDFISIHCPVLPTTVGLIGAEEISLMKPAAYLINTAGWEIVDEAALFQALAERRIAGAALDVYQTHPVSPDSPLLKLDNVLLTPHIGGATEGTVTRYSQMMVEDIIRFLDGKRPKNLVNAEAWQHYVR
ncbi:MAG TPA: 3-phosphoglycerate dehydrogenase [Dehalococcoidia bacterium]|nr:3-phosphoglycerate dehydrogenase [Dehalococcoidia bacterium]